MISYAKICIEIDASDDLVDSFDLCMKNKESEDDSVMVEVRVEYQWTPKQCTKCSVFGHSNSLCPKQKA